MRELLREVKESALAMALLKSEDKNEALEDFAKLLESEKDFLLQENQKDVNEQKGKISDSLFQRLILKESKIQSLAQGMRDLTHIEDPVGKTLFKRKINKDLELEKITVPLGVLGIIFESRPDVIPQILALVLKSGNAAVLKGGREAYYTNLAFMKLVSELNKKYTFFPERWALLIESREDVHEMLKHEDLIDLVVPRGSNELVQNIKKSTLIPVLGHADGVCHIYVHEDADVSQAVDICVNAKTEYPAACNAVETLLVDKKRAESFISQFLKKAASLGVKIYGCNATQDIVQKHKLSESFLGSPADWHTEYSDLRLSIKVVEDLREAIDHINHYGSHHTDAILSENSFVTEIFLNAIDSACVFSNATTRYSDGFKFGFGAEVGISTSKLHARGPVGIDGLITYKYKLR